MLLAAHVLPLPGGATGTSQSLEALANPWIFTGRRYNSTVKNAGAGEGHWDPLCTVSSRAFRVKQQFQILPHALGVSSKDTFAVRATSFSSPLLVNKASIQNYGLFQIQNHPGSKSSTNHWVSPWQQVPCRPQKFGWGQTDNSSSS